MQLWDTRDVAECSAFRDFEHEVAKECAWFTTVTSTTRRQVLLKQVHNGVQRWKDNEREKEKRKHNKRKKVESEDDARGQTARRGESEAVVERPIKREDSVMSDFVCIDALADEPVPATSLHLRLTRRLGSVHPTLCHQKKLVALTTSSNDSSAGDLFERLDFDKLDTAAKLYLGFNVSDELLAIDYGTEDKQEWLFIQDDESFQSTLKTWHLQHPKTMIVEVLLFDRPGFIPHRLKQDLESFPAKNQGDDELDSNEDENENDETEEDDEMQEDSEGWEEDLVEKEMRMLKREKRRKESVAKSRTEGRTGESFGV